MIAHLSDLFFFNDTATTEIYTLSLHDALPILGGAGLGLSGGMLVGLGAVVGLGAALIWAVKEAAAFETMMSRISINVQGASGPALVRIKDDLIRIADASIYTDTQIGLGIAELGVLH